MIEVAFHDHGVLIFGGKGMGFEELAFLENFRFFEFGVLVDKYVKPINAVFLVLGDIRISH